MGVWEPAEWLKHQQAFVEMGDLGAERMLDHREQVMAEHDTVADRIRALHALGYQRTDIAVMLGKSYQHVRNVLVTDAQGGRRRPGTTAASDSPGPTSTPPDQRGLEPEASVHGATVRLRVRPDGSVLLLPEVLDALEARVGGMVIGEIQEGGEMILRGPRATLRHIQTFIQPWKPGEPLLSEQLIADRREEERREREGD